MKHLYVIRHAKSSWADEGMRDFDRPLNDRGQKNAPMMAERLKARSHIDHFVVSPAKRTRQTAKHFTSAFSFPENKIQWEESIYEAPVTALIDVVQKLDDKFDSVAFIGHNYGVSLLVAYLTGESVQMPTCAIATIELEIDSWSLISREIGRLIDYDFPKKMTE
jgi:phosphohistidine phosphatase